MATFAFSESSSFKELEMLGKGLPFYFDSLSPLSPHPPQVWATLG